MFDPQTLKKHSLDMRQFIDCRESVLPDGMRILDVYNASGLHFTILPDRGMDIWTAHYNGLPLTWISPGSPHPPDYGSPWLRQFNGGLLTTCGLTHVGPPETDSETGEKRDLHGNFTRLRASEVGYSGLWSDPKIGHVEHKGVEYTLYIKGTLVESQLFGEQLQLERRYQVPFGEPTIIISDTVRNLSDAPVPFMILYHFNVGYPLVRAGTKLHVPAEKSVPRDEVAKAGFDTWPEYSAAIPQYAEQVFFHQVKQQNNMARIALVNPDFGLELSWATDNLSYFTQWKNVRQGIYVSGIEPGNCLPEGQNAARANGRLVMLQPNESRFFQTRLTVLGSTDAIQKSIAEIENLKRNGMSVKGCNLTGF